MISFFSHFKPCHHSMKLVRREPVELDKGGRVLFNQGKNFPYQIIGKNVFYAVKDCFFVFGKQNLPPYLSRNMGTSI
ncbi:MAG: hypothetical protein QG646_3183, partial [Euryarchaeota archaeon]|nr:hypothetical protein [Euryarchaeota archaeon]